MCVHIMMDRFRIEVDTIPPCTRLYYHVKIGGSVLGDYADCADCLSLVDVRPIDWFIAIMERQLQPHRYKQ